MPLFFQVDSLYTCDYCFWLFFQLIKCSIFYVKNVKNTTLAVYYIA
jgi:hypothetical protein